MADTKTTQTSLGELISALYDEYMAIYKDEDIASVAVAATINDMLAESAAASRGDPSETRDAA
jgi:hypothetical protein